MLRKMIELSQVQMKALARYETTFEEYLVNGRLDPELFAFEDGYRTTLDDLHTALTNILKANPTVGELCRSWYVPMQTFGETFNIVQTYDDDDVIRIDEDLLKEKEPTEEDELFELWSALAELENTRAGTKLSELGLLEELLEEIEIFRKNRNLPAEERQYSKYRKKEFIRFYLDDAQLKKATDEDVQRCRQFTEELCAQDEGLALHLKGYACYGGNRLYDCDWKTSRDCIARLYDKTDDPNYANTLGYIYYYGRCTSGVPEYQKAFEMFSVAAANGLYEGLYKLADMYLHGYACKQSPRTARALYGMVYNSSFQHFLEGALDGSFADAALRMGNVFLKGIGEEPDPALAYSFYLQADYAARLRSEQSDFFGDTTVAINIRKALEETKKELPKDYFADYISMERPLIFWRVVSDRYRAEISVKDLGDGLTGIRVERRPEIGERNAMPFLVTISELDLCKLMTGMEMLAFDAMTSFVMDEPAPYLYDYCEWNEETNRIDFYCDGKRIGWIAAEEYRVYRESDSKPKGKQVRLASVAFSPGGRTYDYLCDIPEVAAGDRVIVPGYDGETEVEVKEVFSRFESELGLPIERYKRVVRKA